MEFKSVACLLSFEMKWRYAKYKIGFDQSGKLLGVIVNFYCDSGNSPNGILNFGSPYVTHKKKSA